MADSTEKILEKILGNKEKCNQIVERIPIDKIITSPVQARKDFDPKKLNDLAQSISANGVLEPIMVRRVESNGEIAYGLIAGERRVRASKLVGETTIPAIVMQTASDKDLKLWGLVENIQREDLTPMEKMSSIVDLRSEFNSNETMASNLGISARTIERYLKIHRDMTSLPDIMRFFERDHVNADYAAMKTLSELAPDIRRIEKRDKREYARILKKFQKGGIKTTLASLNRKFSAPTSAPRDQTTRIDNSGFIETDRKIMLHLVWGKDEAISPEILDEFKNAMDIFIQSAQKIDQILKKDHDSDYQIHLKQKEILQ